jgi:surface carbohydrate biosynthesis protein (TIGR04326 family)
LFVKEDVRGQAQATTETLLLWAGKPDAALARANVVLWHGVPTHAGVRSLRDLVERNAEEIRRRYLAWCHEFGEATVAGRRLRERFAFADGTSLWDQSVFVEQSAWRQRSLEPLLKITAFELLLEQERPAGVVFVGAERQLAGVLRRVCVLHRIEFRWTRVSRARQVSRASLLRVLPQVLQGLLMLLYMLLPRLRLPGPSTKPFPGPDCRGTVLIAGPLFNFDAQAAVNNGIFASRFWTVLPALLKEQGLRITWLQTFYRHEDVPTPAAAARVLSRVNASCDPRESHVLLDGCLTLRGAARIAGRWVRAGIESVRVGRVLERQQALDPVLRYWPLLRHDWARAFRGVLCAEALLYAECYDGALRLLPHQSEGLYLMESQGWERALAKAWRRYGHGRLAGVVHSAIRFWDLRYHSDPRRYADDENRNRPGPDVVILNGPATRAAYLSTATSRETLADCEALRYLHLARQRRVEIARGKPTVKILVLGDFTTSGTAAVLALTQAARSRLQVPLEVRVKPHPNVPVDAAQYPGLDLTVLGMPAAAQAREVDVVLAANLTSAAVDAYTCGARVLIYDDGVNLNYSPLRGMPGVAFVRTADELCEALEAVSTSTGPTLPGDDSFFNTDAALPRWRAYLGYRHTTNLSGALLE